ncbi:hypothetical protein L2E82_50685 [Cichorium intybus]|nr:hypothetical protein L2E82_50685 [Cichorium intybus]
MAYYSKNKADLAKIGAETFAFLDDHFTGHLTIKPSSATRQGLSSKRKLNFVGKLKSLEVWDHKTSPCTAPIQKIDEVWRTSSEVGFSDYKYIGKNSTEVGNSQSRNLARKSVYVEFRALGQVSLG